MEYTNDLKNYHSCNYLNPMIDNANKMLNECINNVYYNCDKNCYPKFVSTYDNITQNEKIINDLNVKINSNTKNNEKLINNLSNFEGFVVNMEQNLNPAPTDNDFKLNTSPKEEYVFFNNNQGYLYNVNNNNYMKVINNGILDIKDIKPEPYEDICYPYNYAGINNQGNILCNIGNNIQTEIYNFKNIIQPNFIPPSLR